MPNAELLLFWLMVFTYAAAFCLHLGGTVWNRKKPIGWSISLQYVALCFHTVTVALRWLSAGHPPVTDAYELNLTCTWVTVAIYLAFTGAAKLHRAIGLAVIPVVFLLLGRAIVTRGEPLPMGPAYQSPWLWIHVIFAWLAFGCFAIAAGAAALLLGGGRIRSREWQARMPDEDILDFTSYRFIVLGFINQAVMLVSGSIWAKKLWGQYWGWDALEVWNLLAFLLYAFYLHARSFLGWKMRRAAWIAALGLIVLSISYWGVAWFAPTIHPGP